MLPSMVLLTIISCTTSVQQQGSFSEADHETGVLLVPEVEIGKLVVVPVLFERDITVETASGSGKEERLAITSYIYNEFVSRSPEFEVAPLQDTLEAYRELNNYQSGYNSSEKLKAIAGHLNADKVFITLFSRYSERVGSDLGIERPASVSFVSELHDVKNGKILWRYRYNETQEPLLSDVSKLRKFLDRGGKWVSARQLAREGVVNAVDKLFLSLDGN